MIQIVKDKLDISNDVYHYKVVDNTYIVTSNEEFIYDPFAGEYLMNVGRMDYIAYRGYLKSLCTDSQWALLNQEHRNKCIENYCKPESVNWDTLINDVELKKIWINIVINERDARHFRFQEVKALISWSLDKMSAFDLATTLGQYCYAYVEYDLPLLSWFTNSIVIPNVIDFSTTGFASKAYYTNEMRDEINLILNR